MSKKDDLLKEAADLQRQADQLRARRAELQSKAQAAEATVTTVTQERGAALLEGRDMVQLGDRLSRARADLDAFKAAIQEADSRIASLEVQISDRKNSAKDAEFRAVAGRAEAATVAFIDKVKPLLSELESIEAIYRDLREIAPFTYASDHTREMERVYQRLRAVFLEGQTVAWSLRDIESTHGNYLQDARKGK